MPLNILLRFGEYTIIIMRLSYTNSLYFVQRYVSSEILLILALVGVSILLGCSYLLINHFIYGYTGFNYLPLRWVICAPIILGLWLLALYAQTITPKLAFFTLVYTTYFFIMFSFAVLTNGMQYTPFPTIDHYLLTADQWFHFDTLSLMHWTAMHPSIKKIFEVAYEFLNVEIILIPLMLPWFYRKERVYQLLITLLVAFILGTTVYYFFPTAAPVSVLHSNYFLPDEQATVTKFYQVHHHLTVTTSDGGMIAFPSFHVIWAILLCYSLRGKKIFLYPFAAINVLVILSTLFLGWHYLVDVIAALTVVVITLAITKKLMPRVHALM